MLGVTKQQAIIVARLKTRGVKAHSNAVSLYHGGATERKQEKHKTNFNKKARKTVSDFQ